MLHPSKLSLLVAAALPALLSGEVTSRNHPVLARALEQNSAADTDGDGVLSLAEYEELQPTRDRPDDPNAPRSLLPVLENGEVVVADFEKNNFWDKPGWRIEGGAFRRNLDRTTRLMMRRTGPYDGQYLLSTLALDNPAREEETGLLVSPPLPLDLDYLVVTMSGGDYPREVCVEVSVDGKVVRSATGKNDDHFEKVAFDLREFRGQLAQVTMRDERRGLWGHLNVDRIVMRAEPGEARIVNSKPESNSARGGFAITLKGRRPAPLGLGDAAFLAGNASIPHRDVLLVQNANELDTTSRQGAIRLRNGEVWRGKIRDLNENELGIRSEILGERKVPLSRLASMEFEAIDLDAPREPGHLYRRGGEPIPGELVWVRPKDIAINCPLGIIPVPREMVRRFVLAETDPDTAQGDEIRLVDGTLLFGKTTVRGGRLVIAHEVLGELEIGWERVCFLRRKIPGLTWLETLPRTVVESIGPTLPPPPPRVIGGNKDDHITALRIFPHTVVRLPLPEGPHTGNTLRGQLTPVPGAKAPVEVTLLAGESVVWKKQVGPNRKPEFLSIDLSQASELTLRVEFTGPLDFPCGIELRDAHILTISRLGTEPADQTD